MSARNRLENKRARRLVRAEHAIRMDRKRELQRRIEYLAYAPPETFEELEEEVIRITDSANEGM